MAFGHSWPLVALGEGNGSRAFAVAVLLCSCVTELCDHESSDNNKGEKCPPPPKTSLEGTSFYCCSNLTLADMET